MSMAPKPEPRPTTPFARALLVALVLTTAARGQGFLTYHGDPIPQEVETLYLRGMDFLARTQNEGGYWESTYGSEPGVVGLAVLAMLAHGEDPNFGPHARALRRGIEFVLKNADSTTGYIGNTMYNHGFATLALAEAYGAVNDPRIGPVLRKAVDLILSAQAKNPRGAWRYSPESRDADTTVSGAQVVALFAARNAGIAVPDAAIKKALAFFAGCQSGDGGLGYTSAGSPNAPRTAIGTLAFALAKQKDGAPFKAASRYLTQLGFQPDSRLYYYLYYASQAYFHADMTAWELWNSANIRRLASSQSADGSWTGNHGTVFSTAAALMSLAVNYRFLPIYER